MFQLEIEKYQSLNNLAEQSGVVILGEREDISLPLCELKQAFEIESNLYNRSLQHLPIEHAIEVYDACVAPIQPQTVLLHLGESDLDSFTKDSSQFEKQYIDLITHIKTTNKNCRIAIISLKNENNCAAIAELNKHLKYIAETEHCEFGNITSKHVWNPQTTKNTMSFLSSMGLIQPSKNRHLLYDLIKILFCYEQPCNVN